MRRAWVALLLVASACSSGPAPILEDPIEAKYTCSVERAFATLDPPYWNGDHGLAAYRSNHLLARVEVPEQYLSTEGTLVVSDVSTAGERDRRVIRTAELRQGFAVAAFAASDDGWLLAYVLGRDLHLVRFDGADVTDRTLTTVEAITDQFQLLPRAGGWMLAWLSRADYPSPGSMKLLFLDGNGAADGELHTLLETSGGSDLRIAVTERAILWTESAGASSTVRMATLDARGELGPPQVIATPASYGSFASPRPALLPLGDGFVAAWPQAAVEGGGEIVRVVIWMARLDASGHVLEAPRPLMEAEDDVENLEPELVDLFGDVLVVWSRGSVIHTCGGCVPNHDLRAVVLSPKLQLVSEVLALPFDGTGGLLGHRTVAIGEVLGIASRVQLHTSARPALAFARCARKAS